VSVLVVGARGRVGREVVAALSRRQVEVLALVRKPDTLGVSLPGVREVVGDLEDAQSLDAALAGVRSAFFVTPHVVNEEALGAGFVNAARRAGVKRLVFASAFHPDFTSPWAFRLFVGLMGLLTHYGPKLRVEGLVRRSGLDPVVLMPSNFFQNDELFLDEIRNGAYPQPLGLKGVNRVDCEDIGEAAARALTDDSVASGAWPLVGPEEALTGPECAAIWAKALGRDVAYQGSPEQWPPLVKTRMHEREARDFGKSYALFHRSRVAASKAALAKCTELLGRAPRSYVDYVNATRSRHA